jgi:hypothetical protein
MITHPKILKYIPLFLMLTAVSFPIQIMVIYGHSPLEIDAIFSKLSVLNEIVISLCVMAAIAIYRASYVVTMLVPTLLFAVGFNNGVVSSMGEDFTPFLAFAGTLGFFTVHLGLLKPEILKLFSEPNSRWWLTSPRRQLELPMMLSHMNQEAVFRSKTFDLSERGTFVSFLKAPETMTHLKINDSLSVCLNLGALTQIRCQAKVVRICEAKGAYPAGIGFRFDNLGFKERRKIKNYIKRPTVEDLS